MTSALRCSLETIDREVARGSRKSSSRESSLIVELVEGRNREIRRVMQVIAHKGTRWPHVQFGRPSIDRLPPGRWRTISRAELRRAFANARFAYL